jgi:beta-lactamase superfamily II metal-dependent hydrolase
MQWEADFLAVGDGERSGDAIALRFGEDLAGPVENQTVVVIDGGTKESGQKLVDHIRTHYRTNRVDIVVSSHPDADHVSGLTVVLENLKVGQLLMHRPWEHAAEVKDLFKSGKLTVGTLEDKLEKALQGAKDLEDLALKKNIEVIEPFTGVGNKNGSLRVLGPTREYYQSLLPEFRRTPAAKEEKPTFLGAIAKTAAEAVKWIAETLTFETLKDDGETPAENNSSVILLGTFGDDRILFTADAGIPALTAAADFAASQGIDLTTLRVMQVPHHGSRRNVGPTILNRLKAKVAIVSASKEGEPKHPSKKVLNALIRRGAAVFSTQSGNTICTPHCVVPRTGWGAAAALKFSEQVEDE